MNTNIPDKQILQLILKLNEEIETLKSELGRVRGDVRILYNSMTMFQKENQDHQDNQENQVCQVVWVLQVL